MPWYAAHTLEYARFDDGNQDRYVIYENILLIKAASIDDARVEAERIARAESNTSPVTVDGRSAQIVFAGIRKFVECQDTVTADFERANEPFHPMHGTEVSYSRLIVENGEEFQKLLAGEPALVWYDT